MSEPFTSASSESVARGAIRGSLAMYVLPLVTFLALSLPKLGQGEFSVDTGWYAAIAHQAWRDAASGHPGALWTLMGVGGQEGVFYFNKPPLVFWIHGLFLWLGGPTLWAARLPSVIAGAACVLVVVGGMRRLCGAWVGMWAGLALATTIEFTRHTHALSLDLWHSLFLFGAMMLGLVLIDELTQEGSSARRRLVYSAGAGVCLGLALMSKPLIGLVMLPMLAAGFVFAERARDMKWLGVVIAGAAVVALPWHVGMWLEHGTEFTSQYFGREIAERAAGNLTNMNEGAGDPLYYLKELVKTNGLWAVVTLLAFVALARGQKLARGRATSWTLALWVVAWFVLLSVFPDKRPRYLLVIYPAMACVSAMWICEVSPRWVRGFARAAPRWVAMIATGVGVAVAALPVSLHRAPAKQWVEFFEFVRAHGEEPLWQGGFIGARAARVYLELGKWPIPTMDGSGKRIAEPPENALVAYHTRDGLGPGENERVEFQSGDLTVTRLGGGGWRPREAGR